MSMKYRANFPLKMGAEVSRIYKTKGVAIREAKKHLNACCCSERVYAEVWEIEPIHGKRTPIWEGEK